MIPTQLLAQLKVNKNLTNFLFIVLSLSVFVPDEDSNQTKNSSHKNSKMSEGPDWVN